MKDTTTGTDTREPRALREEVLRFDLGEEIDRLRAEPEWAERGRTSKTLAKAPSFRLVLSLLRAGGAIGEDDAWAPLAIHVLEGSVEAGRPGETTTVEQGGLAWLDAGEGWAARAVTDAALLLAVSWPEERAGV